MKGLNNFNIIHFQIDIILRFNCYQQPDQVLHNNKEKGFSADAVAFTDSQIHYGLLLCWMNIYLELKKVNAWNSHAVWNIMVESYPRFVIGWNCSSKSVFIGKKS